MINWEVAILFDVIGPAHWKNGMLGIIFYPLFFHSFFKMMFWEAEYWKFPGRVNGKQENRRLRHWLPDNGFPFFRGRFPDITQINLVVFASSFVALFFDKCMDSVDSRTLF